MGRGRSAPCGGGGPAGRSEEEASSVHQPGPNRQPSPATPGANGRRSASAKDAAGEDGHDEPGSTTTEAKSGSEGMSSVTSELLSLVKLSESQSFSICSAAASGQYCDDDAI